MSLNRYRIHTHCSPSTGRPSFFLVSSTQSKAGRFGVGPCTCTFPRCPYSSCVVPRWLICECCLGRQESNIFADQNYDYQNSRSGMGMGAQGNGGNRASGNKTRRVLCTLGGYRIYAFEANASSAPLQYCFREERLRYVAIPAGRKLLALAKRNRPECG